MGQLPAQGLNPMISSLKEPRGNPSNHPRGEAFDIPAFNGKAVIDDHDQVPGLTWSAVLSQLVLPAGFIPTEAISPYNLSEKNGSVKGPSWADEAHRDHFHIGFDEGSENPKLAPESRKQLTKWWSSIQDQLSKNKPPKDPGKDEKPGKWAIPAKKIDKDKSGKTAPQ